jgi:hypothetical protein
MPDTLHRIGCAARVLLADAWRRELILRQKRKQRELKFGRERALSDSLVTLAEKTQG